MSLARTIHRMSKGVLFSCILGISLTGCVAASEWLAHPTATQTSYEARDRNLPPLEIGVTTKEEIIATFGHPGHRKTLAFEAQSIESFGYATAEGQILPYQYIPFVGALAFRKPFTDLTSSLAISFSPQDQVSGLTVADTNAYGDIPPTEVFLRPHVSLPFYGMRNPNVQYGAARNIPNR